MTGVLCTVYGAQVYLNLNHRNFDVVLKKTMNQPTLTVILGYMCPQGPIVHMQ